MVHRNLQEIIEKRIVKYFRLFFQYTNVFSTQIHIEYPSAIVNTHVDGRNRSGRSHKGYLI